MKCGVSQVPKPMGAEAAPKGSKPGSKSYIPDPKDFCVCSSDQAEGQGAGESKHTRGVLLGSRDWGWGGTSLNCYQNPNEGSELVYSAQLALKPVCLVLGAGATAEPGGPAEEEIDL